MSDFVKAICAAGIIVLLVAFAGLIRNDIIRARMDEAAIGILNAQTTEINRQDDGNGNLLVYDYKILKDRRIATVTNIGKDDTLGTEDDWSVTKIDYNKSYLGGKFVGERAKDLLDGVVEGAKAKSKFEE